MRTIIFSAVMILMMASSFAEASTSKELTYSEAVVWRCAVRFVRVDAGYKIVEKDKDAGYMLFEYNDAGKISSASIEILPVTKSDKKYVRVQIHVSGQPSYIESLLFTKLERKLKHEYGFAPDAEYVTPPVDLTGSSKETEEKIKKDKKESADNNNETEEENQ